MARGSAPEKTGVLLLLFDSCGCCTHAIVKPGSTDFTPHVKGFSVYSRHLAIGKYTAGNGIHFKADTIPVNFLPRVCSRSGNNWGGTIRIHRYNIHTLYR